MRLKNKGLLFVVIATSALLGCQSSTAPAPMSVLGTYDIITPVCCWNVGSGTPITAQILLLSPWSAERRVVFRQSDGTQTTGIERGSFELSHDSVTIHVKTSFTSDLLYHGVLLGDTLRISYPNPADGPDLIELYRRE